MAEHSSEIGVDGSEPSLDAVERGHGAETVEKDSHKSDELGSPSNESTTCDTQQERQVDQVAEGLGEAVLDQPSDHKQPRSEPESTETVLQQGDTEDNPEADDARGDEPANGEEICSTQAATDAEPEAVGTAVHHTEQEDVGSVYYLKWFSWNGETYPIVTQNENGPCPLLAILNVLTLSKRISLPPMQEIVTSQQLMEHLGDCILSSGPQHAVEDDLMLNFEQNMQDAISIMHKLQTGIDVNVKFTGVKDFEYTPECVVFDLLSTGLCHGWLMDPQDDDIVKAIGSCSYNQLVEKVIVSKDEKADENLAREGLLAEQFLERTRSQLTYHGLCELNSTIKDGELCVFFRNNHFSTLYKYKGELFLLVTDQGYLTESQVIWETLANVEGDGQFVDSSFRTIAPQTEPAVTLEQSGNDNLSQQQQDYLVALSLEQGGAAHPIDTPAPLSAEQQQQLEQQDFALAIQLQNEENHRLAAAAQTQQQQQQQHQQQQQQPQQQQTHTAESQQNRSSCNLL